MTIFQVCGVKYPVTDDLFTRLNDGFVHRRLEELRKAGKGAHELKECRVIEGTAASCASSYVEKRASTPWRVGEGNEKGATEPMKGVWFTRAHNEFDLLPFVNLMVVGGLQAVAYHQG